MQISKRQWLKGAVALGLGANGLRAFGQSQGPIRIGLSTAQTGPVASGGKAVLLAIQMWRDDVNARGGLLGRKVDLVVYDDQGNPSHAPGIYSKLIDVDKVDLLIGPYGTNLTATVMGMIKQRDLLMFGNFAFDTNTKVKHDKYFNNVPWGEGSTAWASGFMTAGKRVGAKTVAFMAADAEFAQTLTEGARSLARQMDLKTVYDQKYPANTVEYSSMIRAIRASRPDLVFVASYPAESIAIVRAVNEIGLGDSVKVFGGSLVGLQFASSLASLGSMLNGIVNYNHYVPEKTLNFPGVREFLSRWTSRAVESKVDPLGYYVAPYTYAAGQIIEQSVNATKSLDHKLLAKYLRGAEMNTVVGKFRFTERGEWATPQIMTTQFQGIVDKDLEQFRQPGKQVVLYPDQFKSGELRYPYEKARRQT